jgi:hypothetical protein
MGSSTRLFWYNRLTIWLMLRERPKYFSENALLYGGKLDIFFNRLVKQQTTKSGEIIAKTILIIFSY